MKRQTNEAGIDRDVLRALLDSYLVTLAAYRAIIEANATATTDPRLRRKLRGATRQLARLHRTLSRKRQQWFGSLAPNDVSTEQLSSLRIGKTVH